MRILGLIPARGGSKGIPRKNLAPFAGRPLLAWTCEAASAAQELTRVVISTDDEEMAAAAAEWGVDVPFMRPAALAGDAAPSIDVVLHALEMLDEDYDAVCLLQPTNPLRLPADIDEACRLLVASGADAVVSVAPIPSDFHPMWAYYVDDDGAMAMAAATEVVPRRQDLPPAYHREGSLYITRREVLVQARSLYGARCVPYFIDEARSGGIDTPEDLEALERKVAGRA